MLSKQERIELRKQQIGSKQHRKFRKYSDNYNKIFTFFLKSYRSGLLTFCGSGVDVIFDPAAEDGKFSFRLFENGDFKLKPLVSRHPNIFKAVVTAKKAWGLWLKSWCEGIAEFNFTKREILDQFKEKGIEIPDSFLEDFDNTLVKMFRVKYERGDYSNFFNEISQ